MKNVSFEWTRGFKLRRLDTRHQKESDLQQVIKLVSPAKLISSRIIKLSFFLSSNVVVNVRGSDDRLRLSLSGWQTQVGQK